MARDRLPLDAFTRRVLVIVAITSLTAVALLILLLIPRVPLLAFGGVLVAVLLDAVGRWIRRWTHLPHIWGLVVAILLLLAITFGSFWFIGNELSNELSQLSTRLPQAFGHLETDLEHYRWGRWTVDHVNAAWSKIAHNSGNAQALVARARNWLDIGLGAITNVLVILFVGVFAAATPKAHVEGLVRLFPVSQRQPARDTLAAIGVTLRGWLLGQAVAMLFIGFVTAGALWLLSVPLPLVMGLVAAILNFVPNVGPFVAVIPAVLLALTVGPGHALLVAAIYTLVQVLQNHLVTPLVQRETASLPPALLLIAQVLAGIWAGILGVALAAPLTAALIVVVDRLYIGRVVEQKEPPAPARNR